MSALTDRAHAFGEIQQYLVKAALDLFGAYGLPVEYSHGGAAELKGSAVMAVIGYAGMSARGALLILTSRSVVARLEPEELRLSGMPAEVTLRDVLGEFANMLLGRVKNQLLARNMAPLLTTPTTIFGEDLHLPAPTSGMSAWHSFTTSAEGPIFVRFDATFESNFELAPPDEREAPAVAEGEMIAF